ncbi:MAG: HNH endonuclease [Oscillospiraceae bacterium]
MRAGFGIALSIAASLSYQTSPAEQSHRHISKMPARKSKPITFDPQAWPASWVLELIAQGNIHAFYISAVWKRCRAEALKEQHGECQLCAAKGKRVPATTVHHVHPLRQRPDLALSLLDERGRRQLLALCDSCHWHEHHEAAEQINQERW